MTPGVAPVTILSLLVLVAICFFATADIAPPPVTIFLVHEGDTSIWGKALSDESICVKVDGLEISCTVTNYSGLFGVFPLPPLIAGSEIIAWGTYSGASRGVVMLRFWLPVVRK